jgi:hypothetical protein
MTMTPMVGISIGRFASPDSGPTSKYERTGMMLEMRM